MNFDGTPPCARSLCRQCSSRRRRHRCLPPPPSALLTAVSFAATQSQPGGSAGRTRCSTGARPARRSGGDGCGTAAHAAAFHNRSPAERRRPRWRCSAHVRLRGARPSVERRSPGQDRVSLRRRGARQRARGARPGAGVCGAGARRRDGAPGPARRLAGAPWGGARRPPLPAELRVLRAPAAVGHAAAAGDQHHDEPPVRLPQPPRRRCSLCRQHGPARRAAAGAGGAGPGARPRACRHPAG